MSGAGGRAAEPRGMADLPLVPARIVNEHVYCPRLAWLEWEAQAFTDNLETVEGRESHRAVDRPKGKLPEPPAGGEPVPEGSDPFAYVTSVRLESDRLGVVAVVDRVEAGEGMVVPVETKRGGPGPEPAAPLREPELAQTERVLGIEGAAARTYFGAFPAMLRAGEPAFAFEGRNRRPALDPVNATLSFTYGLLVRDATAALVAAGLDPQVGLLHRPQFGRPSLALDLVEEFRPLVGDSVTLTAFNNGELRRSSFVSRGGAVGLTPTGRKALIGTYERRMAQEIRHPVFGYQVSYRRALELQARLLAAVIERQFAAYQPLVTR